MRTTYLKIYQDALRHNLRAIRALVPKETETVAVVKANAYGYGAVLVAGMAMEEGYEALAVAVTGEARQLREAGFKCPIYLLGLLMPDEYEDAFETDAIIPICESTNLKLLDETAAHFGKTASVMVAVDSGMNRIGVHYADVLEFRRAIDFHRGIQCDGVFTHFATADEPDGWDFQLQLKRFNEAVAAMMDAGYDCGTVHCDNTPATIFAPQTHCDMVRVGIGLYGLHPCELSRSRITLDPVMSVRARITRCAHPAMGEGVSYGFTYRVPRAAVQICTIPVGYADGLSRTLSNRMEVIFRGERARQVGNICMDQCMFVLQQTPLHPIADAEPGELVTIVGRDGDAEITMDEMARLRGTINYEVACGFGMRLEKVYV